MNTCFLNLDLGGLKARMPQLPGFARLVIAVLISTSILCGYTVPTHEAIIDSVWDASLKKLLL